MGEFNFYFFYWGVNRYWLSDELRNGVVEVVIERKKFRNIK